MEQTEEYETVFIVSAPFTKTEEEIATSYIIRENEGVSETHLILVNEDCSVDPNAATDDQGKSLFEGNENATSENIITIIRGEQSEHYEDSIESAIDCVIRSLSQNEENSEYQESPVMELEESSIMEHEHNSIVKDKETSDNVTTVVNSAAKKANISTIYNKVTGKVTLEGVVDNLTCMYCLKTFAKRHNTVKHMRNVHKVNQRTESNIRCIECNTMYLQVQKLRDHLATVHKMNMSSEELRFPNMDAFKQWKYNIERKELESFSTRYGARKTPFGHKVFYNCYRSGRYFSKKKGQGQRVLAPGTCKLGIHCTAAITCEERSNEIIVKYYPHHYGHGKKTAFVQLSTKEQIAIQENISNGIPVENLLDDIRVNTSNEHFQQFLLKKRDLKIINNAFSMDEYHPGFNDAESVDRWVRRCCQMEDSPVLFYRQEEFIDSNDFMLIIMSEFQKNILMSSQKQVVCVDSLHRRKGGRFYLTCLFVVDECDVVFPVAFCISNKVEKSVITQFLTSVKESTGPLSSTYLISDNEPFYYDSWMEVMNDEPKWLWSRWYIDNVIRRKMLAIKDNNPKRADIYKTMRTLLECQNKNVFDTMFKNYIDSLLSDEQCTKIGNFILQTFGANTEKWAYCYQKDIKLGTIIQLDVLHRTLRYCSRVGRKQRLDKFIFVIMKLVKFKMLDRLVNLLDEEKIALAIEAIKTCHILGLEVQADHVSSLSDKVWLIRSDEEEDNVFVVREFDSCPEHCMLRCVDCDICVHMYSCSCIHSMINANLCQHIHAVVWKFLTPHFSPPPSPAHDNFEEPEEMDISISDNCSQLIETVMKKTHDMYKKISSHKLDLNKDSLTAIMGKLDELNQCIDTCLVKESKDEEAETIEKINANLLITVPLTTPVNKKKKERTIMKKEETIIKEDTLHLLPNQTSIIMPQEVPSQYLLLLPETLFPQM